MTNQLTKQPSEVLIYDTPFPGIPAGASIAAISSIGILAKGKVAQVAALVAGNQQISGSMAQFTLSGGTDGEEYLITVTVTDSVGEVHEADVELRIEDFTWSVPDGTAGLYLTPAEYITRFGYDETLLLSDTHDVGRIDKDRLGARLIEATSIVDGYVAKRYTTPLNPVPEVIRGIVADLVRHILHGANVPDVVAERQRQAIQRLKDISNGIMVIAVPEITTSGNSGTPEFMAPKRVFDRNSLKDF